MSVTLHIDTTAFNRAMREIARFSGASIERVVDAEAQRVLEAVIRKTPAASVAKIRTNHDASPAAVYDVGSGKKTYWLSNRYPDALWAKINIRRKAGLQRKLKARGLGKQAWRQLGETVGLQIKSPAFVGKAIPSTGRTYPGNTRANRARVSGRYGLAFSTSQPTLVQHLGGERILQNALRGRVKYFERNLRLGTFQDLKKIAARYRGIVAV